MMVKANLISWRDRTTNPYIISLLAVIFLLAIMSLAGLMVWQNYKSALDAGEARAVSSANVVAANINWMMEASDQALRRIDAVFDNQPIRSSADTIADISQAVGDLPVGFQYSVYDEDGRLRMSSAAAAAVGTNISDRPYFQQLRNGQQTVVSPQLVDRISNQSVFVIARRITRMGQFHGAASIAIPVSKLVEFWSTIGLGPNSTVSVIGEDGWLVARYPALDQTINLSKTPLFTDYLPKHPSGFYHNPVSPADGLSRIVGYWKIDGWPLVAAAGVERGEALQVFWKTLRSEFAFGIPVIVFLGAASLFIVGLLSAYAKRNIDLEQALDRNNALFREIHHRVKNNLQAVSALIRMQPMPEDTRSDMVRRISAMIAVHEQIYQSDQFDRVEAAPYLHRLVKEIAHSYKSNVHIETQLENLTVDRDQALPVGLIVNEVVSNAFKYAFRDREGGRLTIVLSRLDTVAQLIISDDGPGMDVVNVRKGMGSKLIAGFVAQLGGKYTIQGDSGTVFTMTMPIR